MGIEVSSKRKKRNDFSNAITKILEALSTNDDDEASMNSPKQEDAIFDVTTTPSEVDWTGLIDPKIRELDLAHVSFTLVSQDDNPWSLERADATELQYKLYWTTLLNATDQPIAPPTRDVDAYAHAHITSCTWRYIQDCDAVFGRFLHHYGFAGIFGDVDSDRQRQRVQNSRQNIAAILQRPPDRDRFHHQQED